MSDVVIHKKPIIWICKRCGNQWPYRVIIPMSLHAVIVKHNFAKKA